MSHSTKDTTWKRGRLVGRLGVERAEAILTDYERGHYSVPRCGSVAASGSRVAYNKWDDVGGDTHAIKRATHKTVRRAGKREVREGFDA